MRNNCMDFKMQMPFRRIIPFCPLCGALTSQVVCDECAEELDKELVFDSASAYCGGLGYRMTFASLYHGLMREAINEYKFKCRKSLSEYFAGLVRAFAFGKAQGERCGGDPNEVLFLFAPSSRQGMRMRGFNQVEQALLRSGLDYCRVFSVKDSGRHMAQQKELTKSERLRQSRDKYEADERELICHLEDKRRIVIVDDIWTTGSTMLSMISLAHGILMRNHMESISVEGLVFARAKDMLAF